MIEDLTLSIYIFVAKTGRREEFGTPAFFKSRIVLIVNNFEYPVSIVKICRLKFE